MPALETVQWTAAAEGLLIRSDIPRRQWNRGMEAGQPQDLLLADPGRSHNVTINPIKRVGRALNRAPHPSVLTNLALRALRRLVTFPLSPLNNLVMVYCVVSGALTTRTSLGMEVDCMPDTHRSASRRRRPRSQGVRATAPPRSG